MAPDPTNTRSRIQVPFSSIPSEKEVYFRESSFFTKYDVDKLPSPAKIRSLQTEPKWGYYIPMRFPEIGVIVKYGSTISIAEGQCLWMIRRYLQDSVPVPEVYGWVVDEGETFIYMELLDGHTLEERWESLSSIDRTRLCEELREITTSLRRLEQLPNEKFIGRVNRQHLDDTTFSGRYEGPFPTVKDFNDWFAGIIPRLLNVTVDEPFRPGLADDMPICFTHNDLHPRNILITSDGPAHILALVDFHQSGWYPSYWEYCKTLWVAPFDDWRTTYIPMFLEAYPECEHSYVFYAHSLGC